MSAPRHASGSIQPYLIAALAEDADALGERPVVVVAPDDVAARDLARELGAYLAPRRVRHYPSRGTGYASHVAPPPHLVGLRIAALDALTGEGGGEPPVVVASAVALAETVPDASLRPEGFALKVGEEIDLTFCAELLAEAGYERVDQVEARGQFALRGGILDVFGATEDRAARLELFGDEIESIRWFSTFTQRSLGEAEELELSPAAELAIRAPDAGRGRARRTQRRAGRSTSCPSTRSARHSTSIVEGRRLRDCGRRGDRARPSLALGGRDGRDALGRRAPPLRGRRGAAGRARGASPALDGAGRGRAVDPRPGTRIRRALDGRGRAAARARGALGLPRGRRLRPPRRGGARALQPATPRRLVPGRGAARRTGRPFRRGAHR